MSTNPAVRKLHTDLSRMNKAEKSEKGVEKSVTAAKSNETKSLASIKSSEQKIIDQFVSAPPTDVATQTKLLGQLYTLGQKYGATQTQATKTIARENAKIAKDKKAVASDRKVALKDLKPAELHLSLKDTNLARKQLGLKALKKPVRPSGPGGIQVTQTMRNLATDARSVAMSMGGFNSEGLCATGVSRAVDRAMGFYPSGNGNTIGNSLLASGKFKQIHIPLAEALKIPGIILSWQHTSTPEGRIFGHTAVTLGNGKESASDFVEFDTLTAAQSRSGLTMYIPK